MKEINIAYSPDSDDLFMLYPLIKNYIKSNEFNFKFTTADIETLNKAAFENKYEISAVSFGVYPYIRNLYDILDSGASIGSNYGPVIVTDKKNKSIYDLYDKKIAFAGKLTSIFLAVSIILKKFKYITINFKDSIKYIKEVDGVVLIHELQLNDFKDIKKICDLGKLWHSLYSMKLPLGCNVISKKISFHDKIKLSKIIRQSIEWSLSNRKYVISNLMKDLGFKNYDLINIYISMYANEDSLSIKDNIKSIKHFYDKAINMNLIPKFDINDIIVY